MSVEGKAKEAAGYIKEEINEHGKSPRARRRPRKVVTSATKAASKTARRRRRRSPAPVTKGRFSKTAPGHVGGGFFVSVIGAAETSRVSAPTQRP